MRCAFWIFVGGALIGCSCLAGNLVSIDVVKRKYEHSIVGTTYLFYPAKSAKRLVISFAGANKDHYSMWSWFWRDDMTWDGTAYLFLKDNETWYVGDDKRSSIEAYSKLIDTIIEKSKVSKEHVFTIGASSGGYAAILYAIRLNLKGAIAINPFVKFCNVEKQYPAIKICKNRWEDLDIVVARCDRLPKLSIFYGAEQRDIIDAQALIDVVTQKTVHMIFHHTMSRENKKTDLLTTAKACINKEIDFLDQETVRLDSVKK